ncbi:MAG: hydrophobe/amphiphile efflux-1 family RND transporter, partial [Hymenobacter sp.]
MQLLQQYVVVEQHFSQVYPSLSKRESLQNTRATIIPLIAIPVSLIGTFAGMHLFGFSINLLTLFGMILAIGIVVDDAIIVIENIERIMREEGLSPKAASIKAMEEVGGPVIAIVLVLAAVFLPISFISGIAGTIYKQFAITIVISVILSGIVALTLTPALCASFIKNDHTENRFFNWFNNAFEKFTEIYISGVRYILNRPKVFISIFISLLISLIYLYPILPKSLLPEEDQGYIIAAKILPPAASINRTIKVVDSFIDYASKNPSVDHIVSLAGIDLLGGTGPSTNAGVSFVRFKDWKYRKLESQSSKSIAGGFMGMGAHLINDGLVLAFNPPAIIGMSIMGGFEAYIQYHGNDQNYLGLIEKYTNLLLEKANSDKILSNVRTSFANNF